MQTVLRFMMMCCLALLVGCAEQPAVTPEAVENPDPNPTGADIEPALATAVNSFGFDLLHKVRGESPNENAFISPASVHIALAMTYNGARNETEAAMSRTLEISGMTRDEVNSSMRDLLSVLANPDSGVDLSIANSIWAKEGNPFNESFLTRTRDYYSAKVERVDFTDPATVDFINGWVSERTHEKIPTIVEPPLDPDLIMILINAVYFYGAWTVTFDDSLTSNEPFTLTDGTTRTVPMMRQSGSYRYLRGSGFQGVRLPYGRDGRLAMYVLLPDDGTSVNSLLERLDAPTWSEWTKAFQAAEGEVRLPRFKMEQDLELNDALKAMGMEIAFNPGRADFGDMHPINALENVYISKVKHKTFVEVNEKGTEAAAVTSVEVVITTIEIPHERFEFRADHPFVFAIVDDESGLVLFLGVMENPES